MSMSLTKDDLRAVKQLIDSSIDERVPKIIDERVPGIIDGRVQPMLNKLEKRLVRKFDRKIDGKVDGLALDIAKFSHETTSRFDKLDSKFENLMEKLASTADMADYNRAETRKLKRKLGLI